MQVVVGIDVEWGVVMRSRLPLIEERRSMSTKAGRWIAAGKEVEGEPGQQAASMLAGPVAAPLL